MRTLAHRLCERLGPAQLKHDIRLTGYEVEVTSGRRAGERVALYPATDSVGAVAAIGEEVEVTALGLGVTARVVRSLDGYDWQWVDRDGAGVRESPPWSAADALNAPPRHPGRPPRPFAVRRLSVELPADLVDAIDAAADNRTAFIERAIRDRLERMGRPE